ncbi:MAG: HlyD family efflux transporter periplasmic adaptor subunit [Acidobacteriota bacterium]|nr:MAG: HlyD family efflux transporter periplasmic adaptor subunit [Acidobacteriota bacterium]
MSAKKWIIFLTFVVVFAVLGGYLYQKRTAVAAPSERDTITVQRADFPIMVDGAGTLEAARSYSIGPPSISNMRRFRLSRMIEEGTQVEEGDFLAEFDGAEISQRLRDVAANFQQVQEELRKKRSDFDIQVRQERLALEQAISDLEKLENKLSAQIGLESAIVIEETRISRDMASARAETQRQKIRHLEESTQLDLQISRSNEEHYQSILDDLLDALDSLKVRAPVNGVVVYQRDWNNEPREIGSNVFALDSVMQIPDLSTLRVKVWVDEVDAGKIEIGQEAMIQVEALQGRTFTGKVVDLSSILRQATYDRPQKVAEAIVSLDSIEPEVMRPGMSARVRVLVGKYSDAIVIPLASINERTGRSFVQVWDPVVQVWNWREIELLMNDGVAAVVREGLEVQERIKAKPDAA